ncbi:MAG: zinc-dependent peptidase [Planctomycetota bacterium]
MLRWLLGDWFGEEPFDPAWDEVLHGGVWQYRFLDEPRRDRVRVVTAGMVRRKNWVGGGGFEVTEPMRVTIAGVAALMTLGLDEPFFFPKLKSIILYPAGYTDPGPSADVGFLDNTDPITGLSLGPRLGEAWRRGPVVLSWRAVERQARVPGRGRNLVLHELAHHLDGYAGDVDGVPHFDSSRDRRRWYDVTAAEYRRLVGQATRREVTLLDHYGATNQAEFFAVATECFFERPHAMQARHADLFALLAKFYRQNPCDWAPAETQSAPGERPAGGERGRTSTRRGGEFPDLSHLGLSTADELFAHGVLLLGQEAFDEALQVFDEVLRRKPGDSEARQHRGEARLALGDYAGAVADSAAALRADRRDLAALLTHAQASLAAGDAATAGEMVRRALREDPENSEAWLTEGELRVAAGDHRRAAEAFRRVLARDPLDALAHFELADCCDRLGDPATAKRHRTRAIALDPSLSNEL